MSLVERGRVLRDLDEERLRTSLVAFLRPVAGAQRAAAGISALGQPLRGKRPRVLRRRSERRVPSAPPATSTPVLPPDEQDLAG